MADLHELSNEELLMACLWAEARGEPEDGQQAVCDMILKPVKKRMAPGIRDMILKPNQFSWNILQGVNHKKVFTANADSRTTRRLFT